MKPKATTGPDIVKKYQAKKADADAARARANVKSAEADLLRAKVEASGRRVIFDYATGKEKIVKA